MLCCAVLCCAVELVTAMMWCYTSLTFAKRKKWLCRVALSCVVLCFVVLCGGMFSSVIAGLFSTIQSLFCGFMVPAEDIPPYWLFLYVSRRGMRNMLLYLQLHIYIYYIYVFFYC